MFAILTVIVFPILVCSQNTSSVKQREILTGTKSFICTNLNGETKTTFDYGKTWIANYSSFKVNFSFIRTIDDNHSVITFDNGKNWETLANSSHDYPIAISRNSNQCFSNLLNKHHIDLEDEIEVINLHSQKSIRFTNCSFNSIVNSLADGIYVVKSLDIKRAQGILILIY